MKTPALLKYLILLMLIAAFTSSCARGQQQTKLPIYRQVWYVNVPAQQLIVANAVDAAVDQLAAQTNESDLSRYQGMTAFTSVSGVFPHSDTQLMNYIRNRVEYQLSRSGILFTRAKSEYKTQSTASATKSMSGESNEEQVLFREDIPDTDLLVNIDVSAAGADVVREREPGWKLVADYALDLVIVGWFLEDMYEVRKIYSGRADFYVSIIPRNEILEPASFRLTGYEEYKYMGKDTSDYPLRYYESDESSGFFSGLFGGF
jgi:hypothetical protein